MTHLVVKEDPDDGGHHAHDVCQGDRVAQHQQRNANDHDPLGGVGDCVAERADEVKNTEGDNVLCKIAEAADEEEDEGTRPFRNVRLKREALDTNHDYEPR